MKTLYLIRHAKSSWKNKNLPDFERPLNKRGKRDAPIMAGLLHERSILPDIFVSSPALRARETAEIIAPIIGFPAEQISLKEEIYGADMESLSVLVSRFNNQAESAIICGHNPTLTNLLEMYTGAGIDNMPTCAVAVVEFDVTNWRDTLKTTGALTWYECPRDIAQ